MSKCWFILFFEIISILGIAAQSASNVILPKELDDVIIINVSGNSNITSNLYYEYLSVYVTNETDEYATINPVQGKYLIIEDNLIFTPYYPFEKGLPYTLKLKSINSDEFSYIPFQVGEKEKVDNAEVLSIFPSANFLPENILRFYIYFKTPMKQEEALKHIKLIDEEGNTDDYAFMKFKEELWSSDGKRLTLLFDPGRIKRGVSTNMKQGPALENGQLYKLNISGAWLDVYEQSLVKNTIKQITVVEPYRNKVNVNKWAVDKPKFNSLDKLLIEFDRIIDHALIQSMIQIRDGAENIVEGYWEILDLEQQIQFVPKNRWQKGQYKIQIDTRLEDISGNNLENLLDYRFIEEEIKESFKFIDFIIS